MRKAIFNKARNMLEDLRVQLDSETDNAMFFKVTPSRFEPDEELLDEEYYKVMLYYENHRLRHSCTCFNMTNGNPDNICSHKVAVIVWMVQNG